MKQYLIRNTISKKILPLLATTLLLMALYPGSRLFAQADSSKQPPETAAVSLSPTLSFVSIQKADKTIDLKASMRLKQKGNSIKLPLLKIKFLQLSDTVAKDLGFVITDRNGQAVLTIKQDVLTPDKNGKLLIKAVFAGNKQMETAEEEISIQKAVLVITPVKEDTLLSIKARLTDAASGAAVGKATIGCFCETRFFSIESS